MATKVGRYRVCDCDFPKPLRGEAGTVYCDGCGELIVGVPPKAVDERFAGLEDRIKSLAAGRPEPHEEEGRLLSVGEVALELRRSEDWVRGHALQLGGFKIGTKGRGTPWNFPEARIKSIKRGKVRVRRRRRA